MIRNLLALTLLTTACFGQLQTDRINARGAISTPDLITSSTPVVDVRSKGAVAGGEICAPLASALAAVHTAGGGRVLVPLTGALTCTSNPFAALTGNENIEIDWNPSQITTTAQWFLNASGVVNRTIGFTGMRLIANASTFPTSTPLLKIGDNTGTLIFGSRFEDGWRFDCNNVAGCNIQLNALNEQAGMRHAEIRSTGSGASAQIVINNAGHMILEDLGLQQAAASMDGISIAATGAAMFAINRITCNQTGFSAGLACIHVLSGSPVNGMVTARDVHAEGYADSVFFDTNATGEVYTADCTGVCTNVIHINTSTKVSAFSLNGLAGTNIVKNDITGCNVPTSEVTLAAYLQNAGQDYAFGSSSSALGNVCTNSIPRYRLQSSATSGTAGRTDLDQVDGNATGWRWESPGSTDGSTAPYILKSGAVGVFTSRFTFDNTGLFSATGNIQGVNLIVPGGGTAADFGDIRIRSAGTIRARNNANSGNNILLGTDSSDNELLYNIVKITSTGQVTYGSVAFASLGTPANGSVIYCSDCTLANPCASGGTGALAKRINGAWICN